MLTLYQVKGVMARNWTPDAPRSSARRAEAQQRPRLIPWVSLGRTPVPSAPIYTRVRREARPSPDSSAHRVLGFSGLSRISPFQRSVAQ